MSGSCSFKAYNKVGVQGFICRVHSICWRLCCSTASRTSFKLFSLTLKDSEEILVQKFTDFQVITDLDIFLNQQHYQVLKIVCWDYGPFVSFVVVHSAFYQLKLQHLLRIRVSHHCCWQKLHCCFSPFLFITSFEKCSLTKEFTVTTSVLM
jgi:hypothetical protein